MAKITEYTFTSKDDRHTKIHAIKWEPENGQVVAVLQLVHGMQEYIERYSEFAEYLTERGFAVYGHDHIGHGRSVADVSERGKMFCENPDNVMIKDMYTNYGIIKKEYPGKPYFILGHSMGSYLLRKYLSVKSSALTNVNGAIIMGTGSESSLAITSGLMLCKALMAVKGRDVPSDFIHGIMFGKSYEGSDESGDAVSNSWLSKNADNVREFLAYDGGKFSLNGYMVLLRSTLFDNKMKNIKRMNLDMPVIFVSGDQDPVGGMGEGVKRAYEQFKAAGVKDLSIKLYEGDRHEILNELDRDKVYADLYEWMMKRIDK